MTIVTIGFRCETCYGDDAFMCPPHEEALCEACAKYAMAKEKHHPLPTYWERLVKRAFDATEDEIKAFNIFKHGPMPE